MKKNLRVKTSKLIDETYKISFKFNGTTYYGYKGDTLASALWLRKLSLLATLITLAYESCFTRLCKDNMGSDASFGKRLLPTIGLLNANKLSWSTVLALAPTLGF